MPKDPNLITNKVNELDIEFFVRRFGQKPTIVKAKSHEKLWEVLIKVGVLEKNENETFVFIGECEEALNEHLEKDGGADEHCPVDINLTLEILEIKKRRHVHCHKCRYALVEVNFAGKTIKRKFSPATTVAVVAQWARRIFRLDPAIAGEYVLRISGTSDDPRPEKHLGELIDPTKCFLSFDLVKEITPQG